ncbi:hypothetical protein BT93_G0680 [Corymbia citriodora subsp. variegata]|nr:hypothetical protein BT93_G0680 [Corymbia citriodora subsp. variegata]
MKAMLVAEEKESTQGASSSSSFPPKPIEGANGQYDVFLSFNGSDTRKEFADHLYRRLDIAGICVFRDCDSIQIGEEFSPVLFDAITCSKISIPIISQHYASSKWCLRKLTHIMSCKKSKSQVVLPIFYKVDPSDVRYLKRSFGEAFDPCKHHFDEKEIEEVKQALKDVSYLHGWESNEFANGREGELIETVVNTVLRELRKYYPLLVPKELVGLDGQLKKIMNRIDSPSVNAQMIGIYGMGGVGKTTLAKCIYNQLSNKFDHVCCLLDIRETTKHKNIMGLQSKLISEILKDNTPVSIVDVGINTIKSRFTGKKVLILLDDVDHKDQLDALAGDSNWFASGSIIIVTTRNKAILDQSKFKVDYQHEMSQIDEVSSLILFKRHAFREHLLGDFEDISRQIVSTLGGLPLSIEIIGSYLYKKTNRRLWDDLLKKLKKQPPKEVQEKLKISYEALEKEHKEIFLDIACFFIGEKIEFAMYMWDDCEFFANQGIEELKLRCLIKIRDDGKLGMHDQLRDFGRSIIRQEQSPEEHSRIWESEEASKVIEEEKAANRLKVLDLTGCKNLRCTPELSTFTKLEILILKDCSKLEQVHSSIGIVKSLISLDLSHCGNLKELPREVGKLRELKELILDFSGIREIPMLIGSMTKLEKLSAQSCWSLTEIPSSMGNLQSLQHLNISQTAISVLPESIKNLSSLQYLNQGGGNELRSLPELPTDLRHMKLSFHSPKLPQFSHLVHMQELQISWTRST